jgi:hypothetical protein
MPVQPDVVKGALSRNPRPYDPHTSALFSLLDARHARCDYRYLMAKADQRFCKFVSMRGNTTEHWGEINGDEADVQM